MSSSKARFFNPAVVGLIMLSFFLGTSEYTVIGILPEIADGFGISLTQAGSIVSLFAFAYGLGTPFLAAYVGKYNRFRITMLGISLFDNSERLFFGFFDAFVSYVAVTATFFPVSLILHHAHTIKQLIPAAFNFFSVFSAFLRSV